MLWNRCHILDRVDCGRRLGSAGGNEEVSRSTSEVAIELGAQRCYETRAFPGKFGSSDCDGIQWFQLLHWTHAGEARFGEQCDGGSIERNDFQEHKGRQADDDFGWNCSLGGRRMGSKSDCVIPDYSILTDLHQVTRKAIF